MSEWNWTPLATGAGVGLLVALISNALFVSPSAPGPARLMLVFQMALAFAILNLFLSRYLELRRRVLERVERETRSDS